MPPETLKTPRTEKVSKPKEPVDLKTQCHLRVEEVFQQAVRHKADPKAALNKLVSSYNKESEEYRMTLLAANAQIAVYKAFDI